MKPQPKYSELRMILDWYFASLDDPSIPSQLAGCDQTCPRCGARVGEVHGADCMHAGEIHTGGAGRRSPSSVPAAVRLAMRRAAIARALQPHHRREERASVLRERLHPLEAADLEACWVLRRWYSVSNNRAHNLDGRRLSDVRHLIPANTTKRELLAMAHMWRREWRRVQRLATVGRAMAKLEAMRRKGAIW